MKHFFITLCSLLLLTSCSFQKQTEADKNITQKFIQEHLEDSYLNLSHLELTQIPQFSQILPQNVLEDVLFINLSNNKITSISKELQAFPNLKEVNLARNPIKKLENLSNIPLLRKLELFGAELESIDLKNVPDLAYLDLSYNKLESNDLRDVFLFTSLNDLQLHRNKITSLQGIENLKNLERVKLEFNNINQASELDKLPKLIFASLAFNPLPQDVIDKWTKISQEHL